MDVKRYIVPISIISIMIIATWTSSNINWGAGRSTRIIKVDGNGYYAYLPAVFIFHDLHFGFFDEIAAKEGYQNMTYDYRYSYDGNTVDKYFAGTALAQLPFFLTAHMISWITGETMDGYSVYYLVLISIASLFYLFISCLFFNKILIHYKVGELNRALVLLAMVFGTNLFYYAVYEPSMSHVYSLGFVSVFIYSMLKFFRENRSMYLLVSALTLGMITFIRPVNLLVIASTPFLAGDWPAFVKGLKSLLMNWKRSIIALMLFLLPLMLQAVIYKLQTGHFWIYSYGEERFYFNQPHMFKMLFSYRKGLFVYSPLLLISLGGLFFLYKKQKTSALYWLVFFLLVTYVLSCWHQWYYGGSFGSRVYVEYLGFFAILLGLLLENFRNKPGKIFLVSIIALLAFYSVFQTYQYYAGILHWSDMNRSMYWEDFFRFK